MKGPEATAGSILSLLNVKGNITPNVAANVIVQNIAPPTIAPKIIFPTQNLAKTPMINPQTLAMSNEILISRQIIRKILTELNSPVANPRTVTVVV